MDQQQVMDELLATFEALRKLGFASADIFVSSQVISPHDGSECAGVVLRAQGRQFVVHVAPCGGDQQRFLDRWKAFAEDVSGGRVEQERLDRIWQRSWVAANLDGLVRALVAKGFKIPSAQN